MDTPVRGSPLKAPSQIDNVHPLQIPNVIGNVMKFLAVSHLEKCRRVCRSWRYESGYHLRRRPKIVELRNYRYISRYIEYMSQVEDSPHSYFQLRNSYFEPGCRIWEAFFYSVRQHISCLYLQVPIVWSELHLILTKYTNTIRHLRLDILPRDNTQSNAPHIITQLCPTLKTIEFSSNAFMKYNISPQRLEGLNKLVDCAQNIETLTLGSQLNLFRSSTYYDVMSMREAEREFVNVILNSPPNRLKKLIDTGIVWDDTDLDILFKRRFPLRSVKIMNRDESLSAIVRLKGFFSTIESTITNLTYTNSYSSEALSHCCVHLKHLTSLTLISFSGSLLFVNKLRALRILTLLEIDFDSICIPADGLKSEIAHNLDTLKISIRPKSEAAPSAYYISAFTTYFRTLRVLHLNKVMDAGITIIFKELVSTLEELKLYDSYVTDESITGLPEETVKHILSSLQVEEIESSRLKISKLTRRPFIGDLRKMKKLTIEVNRGTSNRQVAGDIAFIFGIGYCTGLVELCLENWNVTDISLKAVPQALRAYLTKFDVSKCRNLTNDGRKYLRKNFLGPQLIL